MDQYNDAEYNPLWSILSKCPEDAEARAKVLDLLIAARESKPKSPYSTLRDNEPESLEHPIFGFVNLIMHLFLFEDEMMVLLRSLYQADSEMTRRVMGKTIIVTLYEFTSDITYYYPAPTRKTVAKVQSRDDGFFWPIIEGIHALSKFHVAHRDKMQLIRNSIGAHRNHNAQSFVDVYLGLDNQQVLPLAYEAIELTDFLIRKTLRVCLELNEYANKTDFDKDLSSFQNQG